MEMRCPNTTDASAYATYFSKKSVGEEKLDSFMLFEKDGQLGTFAILQKVKEDSYGKKAQKLRVKS